MICMVPNCPHGICGRSGIPKFPQIGTELPAKSGNEDGRKSLGDMISFFAIYIFIFNPDQPNHSAKDKELIQIYSFILHPPCGSL